MKKEDQRANNADFCTVFLDGLDRLHLISLLLTAEFGKAEKCLDGSLQSCEDAGCVVKAWAVRWARRGILATYKMIGFALGAAE